mgnify:CR=1 FL=1
MIIFKHRIFGDCVLRPTPFVSISSSPIRSKNRHFGSTYTITLTGTILPQKGSPIVETSAIDATFGSSATDPTVDTDKDFNEHGKAERANTIFVKQNAIRELFAYDGMKIGYQRSFPSLDIKEPHCRTWWKKLHGLPVTPYTREATGDGCTQVEVA